MASINVQKSRFAALSVEDDDSDDSSSKAHSKGQKQNNKQQQQQAAQKKKNKKKKQTQAENNELKHLAFGLPSKGQQQPQQSPSASTNVQNGKHVATEKQWDDWQKLDEGYAADAFEKDLQQALLLSKLEVEQKKQAAVARSGSAESHPTAGGDSKESKKKKKKDKPATMSLEEFNRQNEKKKSFGDDLDAVKHPSSPSPKVTQSSTDTKFFTGVDSDVNRILRQEKMQEEYKKQYAAESVITAKYQDQISKMEKEIEFLRATMKNQGAELQQVKKRNKQLCVILAQGEMKDKAEVLMQVDQLTEVKDELTEQVSSLTGDLEKERSKVHALKAEVDKLKGGKHK